MEIEENAEKCSIAHHRSTFKFVSDCFDVMFDPTEFQKKRSAIRVPYLQKFDILGGKTELGNATT
jgi:hypothetical protein